MAIFSAIAAAVGSFFTSLTWGAVGSFLLRSVASMGLSALAQKLSGKKRSTQPMGVKGQMDRGADIPQAFIVGGYATAGSLTYANTSQFGATAPNGWLTWVITLSDLPCTAVTGFWVNGVKQELEASIDGWTSAVDFIKGGGERLDKDRLQFKFYDGTQTTPDPWLTEHVSSTERLWEPSAVGYGKAYVVVRAHVDSTLFRKGFPTFLFEIDGISLYDISKDSSMGGSGAHRWADPATWEPSENAAVQLYNVLRGIRYQGQWFYGLQGVTAAQLPAGHWIAQVNKCAATIEGANGPEPLYRSSGEIPVSAEIHTVIEGLLTACSGRLSDAGGVYKLFAGAPDAPVMALTDADIISTSEQSFTPFLGLADTVNGVAAKYPSPVAGWQVETAPPLYRPDFEAQDGGRRLLVNVSLDFVPYAEQAQRLMQAALNEARRARRHTFHLPPKYWPLEPGDVIQWTSARNGYVAKLFRVDGVIDLPDADVIVDLTEVDPADYDFDTAVDFTPPVIPSTLPQPIPVQEVEGFVVAPASLNDEAGTGRRPAIHAIWNGDLADVRSVIFELRVKATGAAVDPARSDTVTDGELYISTGILPAVTYEVRAKFIPDSPRPTGWSIWKEVTAPDIRPALEDLDTTVSQAIEDAQLTADQVANDLNGVSLVASGVRADHDALVAGFLGADLATAFEDVSIETTQLASGIAAVERNALPNDFAEDGKYWTHNISGDPAAWGGVQSPIYFRTLAGVGRVLTCPVDLAGNKHVAPRNCLRRVPGSTYRLRVTARFDGTLPAGAHFKVAFHQLDEGFNFVSSALSPDVTFQAAQVWETFEFTVTAGIAAAAYILPFLYFSSGLNSGNAGRIDLRLLDIADITDAANVAGDLSNLSATLTNEYLTAADTEQAISAASLELAADIVGVARNAQPNHFAENSKYWTHSISGAPDAVDDAVSDPVYFRTLAGVGRVLTCPLDTMPSNRHVAPKSRLPRVQGNTYRIRATARFDGTLPAGAHFVLQIRQLDEGYSYVSVAASKVVTFSAAYAWETFELEVVADSTFAAFMLPFIYFDVNLNGSSAGRIDVRFLDIADITDAASAAQGVASLSATLTNDYMTAVDTESAVALARSELTAALSQGVLKDPFMPFSGGTDESWATFVTAPTVKANEVYPVGSTLEWNIGAVNAGVYVRSSYPLWIGAAGGKGFRVEIDFTLVSGSLSGAGMMMDWEDIGGANEVRTTLAMGAMVPGEVVPGQLTRANFVVTAPTASAELKKQSQFYFMANYDLGGANAAKHIKVHRIQIFPLSVTEANVVTQASAITDLQGNASAGYLIRASAGNSVSLLDLIAADGSAGSVSVAKISAQSILLDGTVAINQLAVGGGANMLPNSDFERGADYAAIGRSGTAGTQTSLAARSPSSDWTDGVRSSLQLHQSGSAADGYADLLLRQKSLSGSLEPIPVEPEEFYEFSAHFSMHRCTGRIYLQFLDANGGAISAPSVVINEGAGAPNDPQTWQRPFLIAQAPSNAKSVNIILRKFGTLSATSSYLFLYRPMLAKTHAAATQPSTYQANSITYIDGNDIITGSVTAEKIDVDELSAISANIGHFKSAASGERIEIMDDVIKVFDAGGQVRVKIGNLLA